MGLGCKIIAIGGLLTLLGCVGSYQPDIGDSPFKCDPDITEPCPADHDCIDGICRPHKWKAPDAAIDGGEPDGGEPDGGEPDGGEPDGGEPDGGEPDGGGDAQTADASDDATPDGADDADADTADLGTEDGGQ